MKIVLVVFLLLVQAEQAPNKWECCGDSQPLQNEQLTQIKPSELKERVVACVVPHLPGAFDGQGTVIVEVQVDESGNVRCARVLGGAQHPIIRRAALDAVRQWKFEPLMADGKAKPFVSTLALMVSWDTEKSGKQCPKEKRRA